MPDAENGNEGARFVASACIPTGKLQRKRRYVSARILYSILQDVTQGSTARHYRQAKHDSQNSHTISIPKAHVNYLISG
jgi:hypothetical protein